MRITNREEFSVKMASFGSQDFDAMCDKEVSRDQSQLLCYWLDFVFSFRFITFQISIAKIIVKTENNFSEVVFANKFAKVLTIKKKKKIHNILFNTFSFT